EGRDVLAQSQTGTGKTAAFALPILTRLDPEQREPQVLVLAPTRELAIQVARSFKTYARCLPDFHVTAIYGGSDYEPQLRALKRGVQVVVGTPGRVIDHIKRGTLDLSSIRCLVLDEADEMLNMGFLDDVRFVLENAPEDRQIALFSATLPEPIREIAEEYLNNPSRISIRRKTMTAESIRQRAVFVAPRDKMDALRRFLELEETDGVIVFTRTREATAEVAEQLVREGFSAVALNGDMAQKVRERTIEQLKSGQLDILVATDVAARGLDVSRVSHVFNYDLPQDSESYIHRVGRTGRAGRAGQAIIFLTNGQRGKLKAIERMTRQTIEIVQVPDADEINTARVRRFRQRIADTVAQQDISMFQKLIHQFAEESGLAMEQIAAALAQISQRGMPFFLEDRGRSFKQDRKQRDRDRSERDNFSSDRPRRERRDRFEDSGRQARGDRDGADRRPRERTVGPVEPGMDRYRIEVGRRDGVKPGNIVGAIANEAGLDGEDIGPIRILDNFSTVDLPEGMPPEVFETLQDTWVSGRQLRLSLMGEDADSGRPRRPQGRRPEQRGRAPRGGGQKSFSDRPRKRFDRDQKNRSDRPRRTPRSRQS
ncbi:MAG: DEAD/DEAH box helicase, partial [Planctomycetaceae bacterium]|nr:DEAD/DEAH box helicase [Planctomycetaceae bacterium]